MMNGSNASSLLTAMLNQAWTAQAGTSGGKTNPSNAGNFFPTRLFLAFFTAAPTVSTASGSEGNVTAYSEPTCGGEGESGSYARAELTALGTQGNKILAPATMISQKIGIYDDPSDVSPSSTITRWVAQILNSNEVIMFPYTGEADEAHSGYDAPITHFGIFSQQTGGTPIFWGPLESSVTVGANVIPVVLKGKFQVTLG